jgi:hypothetical protein
MSPLEDRLSLHQRLPHLRFLPPHPEGWEEVVGRAGEDAGATGRELREQEQPVKQQRSTGPNLEDHEDEKRVPGHLSLGDPGQSGRIVAVAMVD